MYMERTNYLCWVKGNNATEVCETLNPTIKTLPLTYSIQATAASWAIHENHLAPLSLCYVHLAKKQAA